MPRMSAVGRVPEDACDAGLSRSAAEVGAGSFEEPDVFRAREGEISALMAGVAPGAPAIVADPQLVRARTCL